MMSSSGPAGAFSLGRLTVVGFGLIGASIAAAARRAFPNLQVTAVDRAPVISSRSAAEQADKLIDVEDERSRRRALADSDLTVLAAPIRVIEAAIAEALELSPLVTDCGSTKRSIMAAAQKSPRATRFVAGHPMAGKPNGSLELADATLFSGQPWILCVGQADATALEALTQFVRALGGIPALMTGAEHDQAVAITSHLPQLLASLLLVARDRGQVSDAACGPGFNSATRVAGGAGSIWSDIFATNADYVSAAAKALATELSDLARALEAQPADVERVVAVLDQARSLRQRT